LSGDVSTQHETTLRFVRTVDRSEFATRWFLVSQGKRDVRQTTIDIIDSNGQYKRLGLFSANKQKQQKACFSALTVLKRTGVEKIENDGRNRRDLPPNRIGSRRPFVLRNDEIAQDLSMSRRIVSALVAR